jgi:methyl-coenzyme M reductase subunit D
VTDAIYPQCRIVSLRLLNPESVEQILNRIIAAGGVRRVILHGPSLPGKVPYGPAHGLPNPHYQRGTIRLGEQDVELQVHVGTILLELEGADAVPGIRAACDEVFPSLKLTYSLQEGRFMKTEATLSDYVKYGPNADRDFIGLNEPSNKSTPIIIQGVK